MTEASKRSLRTRRPPQHFNDGEDTEGHGYARMSNPKEYSSPAQELNVIAKLMSKFVNSVNKRLKEDGFDEYGKVQQIGESKDKGDGKEKSEIVNDVVKKKNGVKGVVRNAGNNHKDQLLEQSQIKPIQKKQQNVVKDKSKSKQSRMFVDQKTNANSLNLQNQLSQKAALSNFDREATNKTILQQQQMLLNSNNFHRSQLFVPQKVIEKGVQNKEKLFGRSSYHVAIAYHIHLKNVKESVGEISQKSSLLDPTYSARKLRGQIGKN